MCHTNDSQPQRPTSNTCRFIQCSTVYLLVIASNLLEQLIARNTFFPSKQWLSGGHWRWQFPRDCQQPSAANCNWWSSLVWPIIIINRKQANKRKSIIQVYQRPMMLFLLLNEYVFNKTAVLNCSCVKMGSTEMQVMAVVHPSVIVMRPSIVPGIHVCSYSYVVNAMSWCSSLPYWLSHTYGVPLKCEWLFSFTAAVFLKLSTGKMKTWTPPLLSSSLFSPRVSHLSLPSLPLFIIHSLDISFMLWFTVVSQLACCHRNWAPQTFHSCVFCHWSREQKNKLNKTQKTDFLCFYTSFVFICLSVVRSTSVMCILNPVCYDVLENQ